MDLLKWSTSTFTPIEVKEMSAIALIGNIIPASWYQFIGKLGVKGYKSNPLAVTILAEIVNWYRPTAKTEDGSWRKRFYGDRLEYSYQHFADKFCLSKGQVKEACSLLEKLKLIKVLHGVAEKMVSPGETRTVPVTWIEIIPEEIKKITLEEGDKKVIPLEKFPYASPENFPTKPNNMTNKKTNQKTEIPPIEEEEDFDYDLMATEEEKKPEEPVARCLLPVASCLMATEEEKKPEELVQLPEKLTSPPSSNSEVRLDSAPRREKAFEAIDLYHENSGVRREAQMFWTPKIQRSFAIAGKKMSYQDRSPVQTFIYALLLEEDFGGNEMIEEWTKILKWNQKRLSTTSYYKDNVKRDATFGESERNLTNLVHNGKIDSFISLFEDYFAHQKEEEKKRAHLEKQESLPLVENMPVAHEHYENEIRVKVEQVNRDLYQENWGADYHLDHLKKVEVWEEIETGVKFTVRYFSQSASVNVRSKMTKEDLTAGLLSKMTSLLESITMPKPRKKTPEEEYYAMREAEYNARAEERMNYYATEEGKKELEAERQALIADAMQALSPGTEINFDLDEEAES